MPWFWCIFWTALATWFLLGMYSLFTTYSFSFSYMGKIFALALAYISAYLGYAVGIVAFVLLGFVAYVAVKYVNETANKRIEQKKQELEKEYELRKQELEQEYNSLKEEKEQELQQLQQKIERYIQTEEDIENIKQATEDLFNAILSRCYDFVSMNESLLEALRTKHTKQLKTALKKGVMNEKEVRKKTEKFEKLLSEVENVIKKEIWDYNGFIIKEDDLMRVIEGVRKEYAE